MNGIFDWHHLVSPEEADILGHANNEAYLRWMNEAAIAHSAAAGWPTDRYLKLGQGWVVKRHEIEYLRPALPKTEIVVRTWVRVFEKASSWRCYTIHAKVGGVVSDSINPSIQQSINPLPMLARSQTLWVWITYKTGHPGRIPPEFISSFPILPELPFATPTR